MSKFESVLSDDDLRGIVESQIWSSGDGLAFGIAVAEAIEQAAITAFKVQLAEQEPVWWVIENKTTGRKYSTDCREDAENKDISEFLSVTPLYTHPIPTIEQEPLAWYVGNDVTFDQKIAESWKKNLFIVKPLYENPSPSIVSDKTACISENGGSNNRINGLSDGTLTDEDTIIKKILPPLPEPHCKHGGGISSFHSYSKEQMIEYANSAIEHHRTTKNHIAGIGNMVVPHGYRLVSLADIDTAIQRASVFDDGGDGADPESARSCIEILKSMISSKAVDSLEPKKEVVHDRHTGKELLYIPPVGESLYSMAQARKESFSLALSVDTKEVQTLLQSYLDSLEGWQLVPVKPTEEMHLAARDWSVKKYGKAIGLEASHGCYKAMLAAAPKHTGDSNE